MLFARCHWHLLLRLVRNDNVVFWSCGAFCACDAIGACCLRLMRCHVCQRHVMPSFEQIQSSLFKLRSSAIHPLKACWPCIGAKPFFLLALPLFLADVSPPRCVDASSLYFHCAFVAFCSQRCLRTTAMCDVRCCV